jgi:acetoin utilization deacetylase AcuC-like enzyme
MKQEARLATLFLTHSSARDHDTGDGHPERPARIDAIMTALNAPSFDALQRAEAPAGDFDTICRVHDAAYVEALFEAMPARGLVHLDPDTALSPGTRDAVIRAVGGACHAVDSVCTGTANNAFLAMRPPGHHAERARPMGFCLINTAAVAAFHARARHGLGRVAIVDFDVHHGNGTQDICWNEPDVLYASTHEMPLFPGTGAASERGAHDTIVNVPLVAGTDGTTFREAVEARILPRLLTFKPELIVISAGFDAHRRDPLGHMRLEGADFAWITRALVAVAAQTAGGRIVSVLEGGYDLTGLSEGVAAHVAALMDAAS